MAGNLRGLHLSRRVEPFGNGHDHIEWWPTPSVSTTPLDAEPVDADKPFDDAVDQLPVVYASALRLRALGIPLDEIADRIGVHPEAMDTVLRLADEKLALLQAGTAVETRPDP